MKKQQQVGTLTIYEQHETIFNVGQQHWYTLSNKSFATSQQNRSGTQAMVKKSRNNHRKLLPCQGMLHKTQANLLYSKRHPDPMSRFVTVHIMDRQTDTQTDRPTDGIDDSSIP